MSDLTLACEVSTATTPIDLNDGTNFKVVDISPGTRTRRPVTEQSDFMHGQLILASPLAEASRELVIRVYGSTMGLLWLAYDGLEAAFDQDSYTVSGSIDSIPFIWYASGPANIEQGPSGKLDKFSLMKFQQEFGITIPCNPVRAAGSII